jgi:hypothetical protein
LRGELWLPGAAEPSLEDFVTRVHGQIHAFTASHPAERSHVEVELADGERLSLQSLSGEPGYGFLTLTVHDGDQVIVPVGAIRRITLGPADEEHKPGFALPAQRKGAEPAA